MHYEQQLQRELDQTRRERLKLQYEVAELKFQVEALKRINKNGYFNMEFSSLDCDGVTSHSIIKYTSLEEYYKEFEHTCEWADGPFSYDLTEEEEKPLTTHGHGWDIN